MNQKITRKFLVLVAAASLGFAASARAVQGATAPDAPATSLGLLGQTYAGLDYSRINLNNSPVNADRYSFEYNQPLNHGFDAVFNYDWTQSGFFATDRAHEQSLATALRAFSLSQAWGKPYVEAGLGYDWTRFAGARDHSFAWIGGAGVEFQAAPALTVTPFVRYIRTNGYADKNTADYGVKANYWLTRQWALNGAVSRNDRQDMTYKLGVNVSF